MTREEVFKEFVNRYLFGDGEPQDVRNAMIDEIIHLREENALLKKNLELTIDPYSHGEW